MTPVMTQWDQWGQTVLRDGDVVFRMGDARILSGLFPFSRFLAGASGSRFSHTGIVAIEGGSAVIYDATKSGVGRTPFSVWIMDNIGPFAVKRLKAERRDAIPGVVAYCRKVFEEQVLFDYSFDLDDSALYCLEMTEKAFRSQGLALSEPVRLGDMENANLYPICMTLFVALSPLTLEKPLTLEQAVYMPGNGRHGMWASPLLEAVYAPPDDRTTGDLPRHDGRLSLWGDAAMIACMVNEFRASASSRLPPDTRCGLRPPAANDAVVPAFRPRPPAAVPSGLSVARDNESNKHQSSAPRERDTGTDAGNGGLR